MSSIYEFYSDNSISLVDGGVVHVFKLQLPWMQSASAPSGAKDSSPSNIFARFGSRCSQISPNL